MVVVFELKMLLVSTGASIVVMPLLISSFHHAHCLGRSFGLRDTIDWS